MKPNYNYGIYDFSDYAEEITGDDLFKINGGATSCSNVAPSGPSGGSGGNTNQGTVKPATTGNGQGGDSGTGTSPTGGSSTPTQGSGGPTGPSGPSAPDISNVQADNWTNHVPLQNQAAAKDYYERTTQRNEYYIKKYNINKYIPTDVKIKLIQKELDHEFALAVSTYLGTDYELGGKSRNGIDCSGTITESLKDMGYKIEDTKAATMASGTKEWITILPYSSKDFAGNEGIINFYKLNGEDKINHTNVGAGSSLNYPGEPAKRMEQIIDATSGDTMLGRNGNEGQYLPAGTKIVNQTYAPFSTRKESYPVLQARINWEVLDEKYRY